ncbi:hypothetical protein [Flavobacterium luteolum]|uniref:hypothetical protein n=1 Tax=Flavobacterium luteolum TaxID=3003259 RepID=UPI00248EEA3D|nr:hypothetical protein [Flavobacterium luteolum]
MALKAQIDANKIITDQFEQQKDDEKNDFIFSNYKERINLIIEEINSFNISFHDNTLISNINDLPNINGKKYNFTGIQGINLYLIEYFRQKREHEKKSTKEFKLENSFHAMFQNISNLITLFYNTHIEINNCSLTNDYRKELEELLYYTYYSKLNYFFEILKNEYMDKKLENIVTELVKHYEIK